MYLNFCIYLNCLKEKQWINEDGWFGCCYLLFVVFVLDLKALKLVHWCVDMCVFIHKLDPTEMESKLQIEQSVNLISQGATGCKYILLLDFYFHNLMGK